MSSSEESYHENYCGICEGGGEVFVCDGCPKVYHEKCLTDKGFAVSETEDWRCPRCTGAWAGTASHSSTSVVVREEEEKPQKAKANTKAKGKKAKKAKSKKSTRPKTLGKGMKMKDLVKILKKDVEDHDDYCMTCGRQGQLICCDGCTNVSHLKCVGLEDCPSGYWFCSACIERAKRKKNILKSVQNKGKKRKRSQGKQKKKGKKAKYAEPGSNSGFDSSSRQEAPKLRLQKSKVPLKNRDVCNGCGLRGNLVCCDSCVRSYHLECAMLPCEPPGDYFCLHCTGICFHCETPTSEHCVLCQACWGRVHTDCAGNVDSDDDTYICPTCTEVGHSKLESILSYRKAVVSDELRKVRETAYLDRRRRLRRAGFDDVCAKAKEAAAKQGVEVQLPTLTEDEVTYVPFENREFLTKWKDKSHHHNTWMPESWISRLHDRRMKHCLRKYLDFPPEESEVVPPDYLEVQCVLSVRETKDSGKEVYVKWRGLAYEHSTWERADADFIPEEKVEEYAAINAAAAKREPSAPKPKTFKEYGRQPRFLPFNLHDYQLDGLNFLLYCWFKGENCILADEMGLGKTIQAIALIAALRKARGATGPFLVLGPLSTLPNWEREFAKWASYLSVVTYGGNQTSRGILRKYALFDNNADHISKKTSKDRIVRCDVVLTSYEMILCDPATFAHVHWEALIVDEGHVLKNNKTKLFNHLKDSKANFRVLLTGTPLQNNLDELFNLLSFLQLKEYPTIESFTSKFNTESMGEESTVQKLHDLLRPLVLRRLKAEVFTQLPEKAAFLVRVDMAVAQKELYRQILKGNYKTLTGTGKVKRVALKNICIQLRKVCCHPYLFPGAVPEPASPEDSMKHLIGASGKLVLLDKMLDKLKAGGHRPLIFSQSTKMLDILSDYMDMKQFTFCRLDGAVRPQDRQRDIDRFNAEGSDVFCYLISTRAGRLGINLQTADTIVLYDSDWNPHNDLQAVARAHRIGQQNKVMVYQLITRGSVEEKVIQTAKRKLVLEHVVVKKMDEQLADGELDAILKYGAEALFEEGADDKPLAYDDAAVDALLDRSREADKDHAMMDDTRTDGKPGVFSGLSFARLWETDAPESTADVPEEAEKEVDWGTLLKGHPEVKDATPLGKGQRERKTTQYFSVGSDDDDPEYLVVDEDDEDDDYGEGPEIGQKRKRTDVEEPRKKQCIEAPGGSMEAPSRVGKMLPPLLEQLSQYQALHDGPFAKVLLRRLSREHRNGIVVQNDGYYYCFFKDCPVRCLFNFGNHIAAHMENGDTPTNSSTYKGVMGRASIDKERMLRSYGPFVFSKVQTEVGKGKSECFFSNCKKQLVRPLRHYFQHELNGHPPDPVKLFVLMKRWEVAQKERRARKANTNGQATGAATAPSNPVSSVPVPRMHAHTRGPSFLQSMGVPGKAPGEASDPAMPPKGSDFITSASAAEAAPLASRQDQTSVGHKESGAFVAPSAHSFHAPAPSLPRDEPLRKGPELPSTTTTSAPASSNAPPASTATPPSSHAMPATGRLAADLAAMTAGPPSDPLPSPRSGGEGSQQPAREGAGALAQTLATAAPPLAPEMAPSLASSLPALSPSRSPTLPTLSLSSGRIREQELALASQKVQR